MFDVNVEVPAATPSMPIVAAREDHGHHIGPTERCIQACGAQQAQQGGQSVQVVCCSAPPAAPTVARV